MRKNNTFFNCNEWHKEGIPIRLVVSFVTAPSYKLSKKLFNITQFHTNSKFSIKNSSELIHKVKDLHIPDRAILLSFDIRNLFPSVPPASITEK